MSIRGGSTEHRPSLGKRTAAALAWLALAGAGGCSLGYYAQAVGGQLDVMARREPIEALIADPGVDAALKARLRQVLEIRDYASRELGLPDNGSYRSYADVERPYVVWNVFATEEFSVEPQRWCFLIVGCVAYRGYFDERDAERFAARLAERSYDVFVAPVPAYSTLGRFEDPVLNTMIHWDDVRLAAIIFHELTHQRVYFRDDAAASESLASLVEREGVRRWLTARQRDRELAEFLLERERQAQVTALVVEARARLASIYAGKLPPAEMRAAKRAAFARLREDYRRLKQSWGDDEALFDPWFDRQLNNAHLVSIATYGDLLPAWQALLESLDGDLAALFERAEQLAGLTAEERLARLRSMAGTAVGGP